MSEEKCGFYIDEKTSASWQGKIKVRSCKLGGNINGLCEENKTCFIKKLIEQLQTAKKENEKLKEFVISLNMKKYYCSKEVYDILEDAKNKWQGESQLESERVMEIVKLKRENKDLTKQNKQMRKTLKCIKSITDFEQVKDLPEQRGRCIYQFKLVNSECVETLTRLGGE